MAYPAQNKHRPSRRKLGRGQVALPAGVIATVTTTGTTNVTVTFAAPVIVTGNLPLTVSGLTIVSQTIVSPTVVTLVMSGNVAGKTWVLQAAQQNCATYQGGPLLGCSGTF